MRAKFVNIIFKWLKRIILIIIALIALLLIAIYLPPVQDFALKKILTSVNSDPDAMQITVGRARLYPPLHLDIDNVTVSEAGDTMAVVGNAEVRVSLWPLLKGAVGVNELMIKDVKFNMAGNDTTMNLGSQVERLYLANATVGLSSHDVDVDLIMLRGARVDIAMPDSTTAPADTTATAPLPWRLNLNQFRIDSLTYTMTMPGTIDTLAANIGAALIENTAVDLSRQNVDVKSFVVEHLSALYLTPPAYATTTANTAAADTVTTATEPWTVNVTRVELKADSALYGVSGARPMPGFDMNYIAVSDVSIVIDSLMNRGTELRLPIKRIAAHERCGIDLRLKGLFTMNSDSMVARDISLGTLYSGLRLDAMMGMKSAGLPMPLQVNGHGYLSPNDIKLAMPSMTPMLAGIPSGSNLDIDIDIQGLDGVYDINTMSLELPRCFNLGATGYIAGAPDIDRMTGRLNLSGRMAGGRWIRPTLAAAKLDKTVNFQPLSLRGDVKFNRGTVTGGLTATTLKGKLAMNASWAGRSESYKATLNATELPVEAFMPSLGIEKVTADVTVNGRGYNPMDSTTTIDANVRLLDVTYMKHSYSDVEFLAHVAQGDATVTATSGNPDITFDIRARGNLATTPYVWTLNADIDHVDLQAMGITDSVMNGSIKLNGNASISPAPDQSITAALNVETFNWNMAGDASMSTTDLRMHVIANDSLTSATIKNHDLDIALSSPTNVDSIMSRMPRISAAIDTIMATYNFKTTLLSDAIPTFTLDLSAGEDNIISSYLDSRNMGWQSLFITAGNDSITRMRARAKLLGFNSGTTVIDTITARINQTDDTLAYRFHVGNRPGTLDQWAKVNAVGRAYGNHTSLLFNQHNINGEMGYWFGFIAGWSPDYINVRLVPTNPIIGYKKWTVNDSNYVTVDRAAKHFDADLSMFSTESSIHLYTEHDEHNDSTQEDLILNVKNIKLAEWIAVNPFAPPVTGDLSADMRFGWDRSSINGHGLISLTDLFYNKQRVGSFDLGLDLSTNTSGTVKASAALMVDSIKTITAEGNLNDSTARNPFLLDFKMIHFPLHILNPFLPKDMARLRGTLNGTMDITGSLAEPIFNGFLDFDSTALTIPMFGTSYTFSDVKIPMDSNIVKFNNFTITGANTNPLSINGTVDARHISDILIDLSANAYNMQIVNSKKKRGVQVYGKAFIDLDATVRGTMSRLGVKANLSVLENTNVTYIMESATDNLSSRSNTDMVKFVNFADTTLVQDIDSVAPSSMMMSVDAVLNLRQGSTIGIDLSTDGKNRVQLLSQGSLNYNMSYMGDTRLTGRLNLNGGYVRYTPPFMSEKLFDLQEGSYVSFNGNMFNPYLNIRAIDVLRANVQQDGQNSRLINFDVILSVTNSLDNMDVAFDLSTDDDITVANELQSMSAEQRANQAMNMLLYNVYTGPGTRASSSLNGNPLFSFLESKVNSWAANNIKGVDLSFGIDQYDRTVNGASSTTTSYSYKVSKALFNDRFKISIGGNYASDADPDQNLAQNLINDISFEYDITPSGSMYVKIFRHTGYESILEGEVTQTGVGFVYKRKLRKLRDLFKPLYRRQRQAPEPQPQIAPADSTITTR